MRKLIFKCFTIASICSTSTFAISCGPSHIHQKGELIKIIADSSSASIFRPGIFHCFNGNHNYIDQINSQDLNFPILDIDGSLEGISKQQKVDVVVHFAYSNIFNFDADATLKLQGAYTSTLPKPNYNLQLFEQGTNKEKKLKITFPGWPELSKFTLKANYVDHTQTKNVVAAKIYGDVIHQRPKESDNDKIYEQINGGAIDGFPILVYNNGQLLGLYTFNIPKSKQLFGMKDDSTKHQAMLMAKAWEPSNFLKEEITTFNKDYWEIEHNSTDDNEWIRQSFNNLIYFVMNNDGDDFVNGISQYLDVSRTIDYICYINFGCMVDNYAKNIMWITYDGVHWTPSAYDLDGTFGIHPDGRLIPNSNYSIQFQKNLLFERIYKNMYDQMVQQYKELRLNSLSLDNVLNHFNEFENTIPKLCYEADENRWPNMPSIDTNNYDRLVWFMTQRAEWLDKMWES